MSKYFGNKKNKQIFNGVIPRYEKAIETFSITLEKGYSFAETNQNCCYYNKITKQVTLVFYINGPIYDNWLTIGTIPEEYSPPKAIYIESTVGVDRALIQVCSDGLIKAWTQQKNFNNVRGTGVYYTF